MSDLVERLRNCGSDRDPFKTYAVCDEAAARIEALEAALDKMAADSDVELTQLTHAVADNIRKIETLEAALRACVQYHVKAAADNRAIAAVNQNNDLGENSLNHAVDHEIAAEDIGDIVRAALEDK
jgi:predicted DNA-binding ribbon-helix-helix protein